MVNGIVCARSHPASSEVFHERGDRGTHGKLSAQQEVQRVTWVSRRELGQRPPVRLSETLLHLPIRRPSSGRATARSSPDRPARSLQRVPQSLRPATPAIVGPAVRPTVGLVARPSIRPSNPPVPSLPQSSIRRSTRAPMPSLDFPSVHASARNLSSGTSVSAGAKVAWTCLFGLQLCLQRKCWQVSFSTTPVVWLCVSAP